MISILLPTYNGASRIKNSIESIISQYYTSWELLVIDDGSSDNTSEIVGNFSKNDPRIIYIRNEHNLGIQKTLNKGIKESRGEYIARIDDDDTWCDRDKLSKQIEFIEAHKDCVIVGTGVIVVDENNKELFRYLLPKSDQAIRNRILGKNCFVHSSVLFRKDLALGFGGYDETQSTRHLEDYDLWLKLGTIGQFYNLPFYCVRFTLREGSLSSMNKIEQFKKSLNIIRKFKNNYPRYLYSFLRSIARLIIYGFIVKLPIKFSLNKIIKLYKEI